MALTNKLSAIGDAIREKTGKSEKLTLEQMPVEIASITTGGGDIEVEPVVLTDGCQYACSGAIASKYIEMYGDTISTKNINNADYMFYAYKNEYIPFDINIYDRSYISLANTFSTASKLMALPKINNVKISQYGGMCNNCNMLREIPEDWCEDWDWSVIDGYSSAYSGGSQGNIFNGCNSLRTFPAALISHGNRYIYNSGNLYYYGFGYCYVLDEIKDLIVYDKANWTSNGFIGTVDNCNRLKTLTFETNEDGTPKVVTWDRQTLDLSSYIGYSRYISSITAYNSGITADKEVKDDATYQALKNDPDWFTLNIAYSRYNHDSAVATINSLPDASAYLAERGGTNTIKFKGEAGSATDGGAINTLTEEEIAVAVAKGWTVTLS